MVTGPGRRGGVADWRLYVAVALTGVLLVVVWISTWTPYLRVCEQAPDGAGEVCRPLGIGDAAVWLTLLVALAFAAPYVQKYVKRIGIPGVGEVETQETLPPDEDVAEEFKAVDAKAAEYRRWLQDQARQREEDQS
ncbi:hypothetical protein [Pseudonocardia phyllosphaerae]|uniref:hypothetical protein n=1 Tax=Pseudonocardia phyllosphaerae TaxID=3390502 RepID=UPI003979DD84